MCLRPRKKRDNRRKRQVRRNVVTKRSARGKLDNKLKKQQVKSLNAKSEPRKLKSKSTNVGKCKFILKPEELIHLRKVFQLLEIFEEDVDIIMYFGRLEKNNPIKKDYLMNHRTTPHMRTTLIKWMVGVNSNFNFMLETLYLSVSLLDYYLQENVAIGHETLQLVGVTAICIAAKYYHEKIYGPKLSVFASVCDNPFTAADVFKIKLDMLSSLKFNIERPLAIHFLRFQDIITNVLPDRHHLAEYLLGIFLYNHESCYIKPSLQAAAACCLSMSILSDASDPSEVWTMPFVFVSSYEYPEVKPAILHLAKFLYETNISELPAIGGRCDSCICENLDRKLRGPLIRKLVDQCGLQN